MRENNNVTILNYLPYINKKHNNINDKLVMKYTHIEK